MGDSPTIDALFDEIEYYMGIHLQSWNARKELATITMASDESVSRYYYRILKLWQKAKTAVDENIEGFILTLKPSISNSLMGSIFTELRPLLDEARRIEDRRMDFACDFSRPDKPASLKNSSRERRSSGRNSSREESSASSSRLSGFKEKKPNEHANSRFILAIVKPAGGTGSWYDPDPKPKKLEPEEREMLLLLEHLGYSPTTALRVLLASHIDSREHTVCALSIIHCHSTPCIPSVATRSLLGMPRIGPSRQGLDLSLEGKR